VPDEPRAHWGHRYATEAARAALRYGFDTLGLEHIIAITSVGNSRSRRVMTRLGMMYQPDEDFDHPRVPADSPIRRHVLYRIDRAGFSAHEAEVSAFDSAAYAT
jgi:RimJ/RimL family protein N-acetyltransferase